MHHSAGKRERDPYLSKNWKSTYCLNMSHMTSVQFQHVRLNKNAKHTLMEPPDQRSTISLQMVR